MTITTPVSTAMPNKAMNPTATATDTPTPTATSTVAPTPTPTQSDPSVTKVLSSEGGSVVAQCSAPNESATVYLVSWSPTQGYEASDVTRGPTITARVVFESAAKSVTMTVTCPDGPGGRPVRTAGSGS